jgi:hypothetical protein
MLETAKFPNHFSFHLLSQSPYLSQQVSLVAWREAGVSQIRFLSPHTAEIPGVESAG